MSRRGFSSTYVATTLVSGINTTDVAITVTASSGVPATLPWTGAIDRGTSNEELVTVTGVAGTAYTITRASDGQSAKSHSAGASFEHVVSARDFDEPNAHINDTARNDHTQYLLSTAAALAYVAKADAVSSATPATEGTTSTTYVDLATVGPQVTVTVGASGRLLIRFGAQIYNATTANTPALMSFALSGANTLAAADSNAVSGMSAVTADGPTAYTEVLLTGLTPGVTTITAKYKSSLALNQAVFYRRRLTAEAH